MAFRLPYNPISEILQNLMEQIETDVQSRRDWEDAISLDCSCGAELDILAVTREIARGK